MHSLEEYLLNINSGHNEALQNTCKRLHDYSYFIGKVKEFLDEGLPLEVAITAAIDYCIDKDVLADILGKCRSEVFDMLLTKYDAKFHEKCIRQNRNIHSLRHPQGNAPDGGTRSRLSSSNPHKY